jgi:ubiquitin carboxyl-terminal hydrolase 14
VNVKWNKEKFQDVELDTAESPIVFKSQLFALSGVEPDRQKVVIAGKTIDVCPSGALDYYWRRW